MAKKTVPKANDQRKMGVGTVQRDPSALAKRWHFQSPKNNSRMEIRGEVPFILSVLAEGSPHVGSYIPSPNGFETVADGKATTIFFTVALATVAGQTEWWDYVAQKKGRPDAKALLREKAVAGLVAEHGAIYRKFDDDEIKRNAYLFENLVVLCAAVNRCRFLDLHSEEAMLAELFATKGRFALDTALSADGIDRAHMLAVIGQRLMDGRISADLATGLLTHSSILREA